MSLLTINLLPEEFITDQIKKAKFYRVQSFSIVCLLLVFFLSSLIVSLRILQSQRIKQIKGKISDIEQRIGGEGVKEGSLVTLKNRLTTINQYLGQPSQQSAVYQFLDKTIPPQVVINSLSVDKTGDVSLSLSIPDLVSLDGLISSLTNKEKEGNKISEVTIDTLSRSRDQIYKLTLKLKTTK